MNDDKVELLRGLSPEQRGAALDALVRGARESQQATLVRPLDHGSAIPLSLAQQRLWLLERLQPGGRAYNELSALRVSGPLDVGVLERSLSEIVRRHAPLRTTFPAADGKPVQAIAPARPVAIPVTDLRALPEAAREAEVERLIGAESQRPLELERGPLLRVSLLRLEDDRHVLLVAAHHIILDGWSMGIFRRELSLLYHAYRAGRPSPLEPLPVQYADFAVWERERLEDEDLETQLRYWKRQLAGAPAVLQLHVAKPRPADETFRGGRLHFELGSALSSALETLSNQVGVTLFATLLAGFQILLARYSGQTDVPVGTVVAKRDRAEIENLIGFFVNTLVMRGDLSGDPTVAELLQRVSRVALEAYEAQDVPFEQVVEALQPKRAPGYHPLFQALFSLHKTPGGEAGEPALALTPIALTEVTAKFDLILTMEETPAGLEAYWEYNRDLFERDTVERMSDHLRALLRGMAARPDAPVADVSLLSGAERRRLLDWSVEGAPLVPDARCIHQVFEGQAERTPDAPAVVCGADEIAYGELNRRANVLARRLRALGVGPGRLVAVHLPRSVDTVVGLLAVLKAGGAYVPLDPAYPPERLAEIVADAKPAVLLTGGDPSAALPAGETPVVRLDAAPADEDRAAGENPAFPVGHDDPAYAIYTSGSSGTPKGVPVTHGNLMHSTAARWSYYEDPVDAFLLLSSFAFDSSVAGTYWTLTQGGTLVLVPDAMLVDVPALRALIAARQISHVLGIPSLYAALLEGARPGELDSLRVAIVAGETCRAATVEAHQRALPHAALFNEYGPTEATVWSTVHRCDGPARDPVPIGRPSPGTQVFILDPRLEPVPVGVPGELHVGGPGVTRGYLDRPDLTREKFVTAALGEDAPVRLYKTGDVARYRADGRIELVGRTDQQVKVRGFRVELGEIESALARFPGVREAAVVARENAAGDKRLVAFVECPAPAAVAGRDVQRFLAGTLPAHAVPAELEVVAALPRLPNGKVDRASLPQPGTPHPTAEPAGEEWSELERALADVWKSTLNIDTVGRQDNFFEVGGDSLTIIRVYNRLREITGGDISITDLFKYPTIEGFADFIGDGSETGNI